MKIYEGVQMEVTPIKEVIKKWFRTTITDQNLTLEEELVLGLVECIFRKDPNSKEYFEVVYKYLFSMDLKERLADLKPEALKKMNRLKRKHT